MKPFFQLGGRGLPGRRREKSFRNQACDSRVEVGRARGAKGCRNCNSRCTNCETLALFKSGFSKRPDTFELFGARHANGYIHSHFWGARRGKAPIHSPFLELEGHNVRIYHNSRCLYFKNPRLFHSRRREKGFLNQACHSRVEVGRGRGAKGCRNWHSRCTNCDTLALFRRGFSKRPDTFELFGARYAKS